MFRAFSANAIEDWPTCAMFFLHHTKSSNTPGSEAPVCGFLDTEIIVNIFIADDIPYCLKCEMMKENVSFTYPRFAVGREGVSVNCHQAAVVTWSTCRFQK